MSYNFEGKIVNQPVRTQSNRKVKCEKCSKEIDYPEYSVLGVGDDTLYEVNHYLNSKFFIYETKVGVAVAYCSNYCRKKHNHRYKK